MGELAGGLRQALADRYTIERELGRGGMATVYLARDLKHDRPVALKVLHPELAAGLGPERFLREVRLAARLQHPHVLTVLDSGEVVAGRESRVAGDVLGTRDPRPATLLWFTMPFVDGESLRTRLAHQNVDAYHLVLEVRTEVRILLDREQRARPLTLLDRLGLPAEIGQDQPPEHMALGVVRRVAETLIAAE